MVELKKQHILMKWKLNSLLCCRYSTFWKEIHQAKHLAWLTPPFSKNYTHSLLSLGRFRKGWAHDYINYKPLIKVHTLYMFFNPWMLKYETTETYPENQTWLQFKAIRRICHWAITTCLYGSLILILQAETHSVGEQILAHEFLLINT